MSTKPAAAERAQRDKRQLDTWAKSNEQLSRERKRLYQELTKVTSERDAILALSSWRLTAPLQLTMRLLRKLGIGTTARPRDLSEG